MTEETTTGVIKPPSFALAILMALQGKAIYMGTVPEAEIARRRKANKRARLSRRANRG